MKTQLRQCVLALLIVLVCAVIGFPQASGGYHLLKKIEVGGEGGWDYLFADSAAHRLYVSHATKVVVIDTETQAVVGEIPNTNGVHGIAIASELGRGFTSNGRDNSVTIFDLKTLKAIGTAATGKNPDSIIFDPATKRVFAFNGGSANTTAIDAATGKVEGTIDLGGKPEFATSDGKGMVFVNIEDKNEVVAIDSKNLVVKHHWPITPGEEASGMAIDLKHHRIFMVCSNKKMIVMDFITGKVVADVPIGEGSDAAGFDPDAKLAFSSNGAGTLTVIHEDSENKFSVIDTVTTKREARTMALDPKTHRIYLSAADYEPAPAPTKEVPRPRPKMIPGSFSILVYGK